MCSTASTSLQGGDDRPTTAGRVASERRGVPRHGNGSSLVAELLKGAVAGAAAVWVMDRVDWFAYDHEDPEVRGRTALVRPGGMDPAHVTVNKTAGVTGVELSPPQPHPAGIAVHYGIGIGPAALYAVMRDRLEGLGLARGPLYGLALFVIHDEVINPLAGLSAPPNRYPWQAHARGLVAHLAYGLVVDGVLTALDAVDRTVRRSREGNRDGGFHREHPGGPP